MKKQLLMKTFLVAVSMLVGTSAAWGASTTYVGSMYTYDVVFGTPNAATPTDINGQTEFTSDNSEQTFTTMSLQINGSCLAGNQGGGRTYSFTNAQTTGKVYFKANGHFVGGNYNFFSIKGSVTDSEEVENASYDIVQSPYALPSGSGATTVLRIFGTNITASYVYTPRNVVYGFDVTIDIDNQKVDYVVTYASKGSSGSVTALSTVSGSVPVPDGYTLNSVSSWSVPRFGQNVDSYYDNVAFYSAVLNSSTHSYTINAKAGSTVIQELATGLATEGDSYGTYLPKAILYNSQYYVLNDANVSNFYANFTMGDDDVTKEVTYTLNANMKAFWEGENMSYVGHSWYTNGDQTDNSGCSNGGAKCPYSGTSNGIRVNSTIASGVYDITIKPYRWKEDAATDYTLQYSTDNENWTTVETVSFASTSNDAYVADNILIPGDSYLRLLSPGSTPRHAIDYIYVERTGDATVTATIPTSGYGTIASAYALDCANLPAGLKAYKVTGLTAETVTLEEVNVAVAANTGLILNGTAGAYNIPVAATGTDISTTNKLKAAVTATAIDANKAYILQGGLFHLVTAASTIPAGKAYLLASDITGGARSLNFTFDATAIKAVEGEAQNGEFYNVAGQRVAQPTKGLYIVNGKKVVVK
jgi:hypothetical protein